MIISLFYTFVLFSILACYMLIPRKRYQKPPFEDGNDDDGGEPLGDDLPDLDLPPGISLPINDFEPDYNRPRPKKPSPTEPAVF